ncbi:MAG: translocation/assembly module TamB domain-containing protein [Sandaracinus sp.]|nr:translocation/assembly module TamB domain-containing protein [Sandaracinus sp.]MCB9634324.1 translocation/assembly module TamB domain-containing protein [Sandaracinus sp.]
MTDGDDTKRPARRFFRRVGTVLFFLVVSLLALATSTLAHLNSPVARRTACDEVRTVLNDSMEGRFELDACRSLSWREVRVEGFRVFSLDGAPVLDVRSAVVRPDVRATLRGVPTIDSVDVDGALVDLRDLDAFVDAFGASTPSPPSDLPVVLPRLDVRRVNVRLDVLELPEGLRVSSVVIDGRVALGPSVRVDDLRVRGEVRRYDAESMTLSVGGDVDLGADGQSTVTLGARHADVELVSVDADVRWGSLLEAGPAHVDTRVEVEVTPEQLRAMGAPELAGVLVGPVEMDAHAEGALDALTAEATVRTGEQVATLGATLEGETLEARVATEGLRLSQVLGTLPDAEVAGEVAVVLAPDGDGRSVRVRGESLRYDAWRVPGVELEGRLAADGTVSLEQVDLPHLEHGGHLDVTGTFGESIALRFDVDVPSVARDANVRAMAPGVDARVTGRGRFELEGERMEAEVDLRARELRVGGVRAAEVAVRGSASGSLDAPRARLTVEGRDVVIAGEPIAELRAELRGGPSGGGRAHYDLTLDARGRGRLVHADVDANLLGSTVALDATARAEGLWPSRVDVRVAGVRIDERGRITIGSARVEDRGGAILVDAGGTLVPSGRSDLHLLVDGELAAVDEALELGQDLRGRYHAEASLRGTLTSPELLASLTVDGLGVRELPESTARVELTTAPGEATLAVDLRGAGSLDVRATLRSPRREIARIAEGTVDARVEAHDLALGLLETVVPDAPALDGSVSFVASASGATEAPELALELTGDAITYEAGDAIDVRLTSRWVGDALEARLAASDRHGALANVDARAPIALDGLDAIDPEALASSAFTLDVELPSRDLSSWPRPFTPPVPADVGLRFHAEGGPTGLRARANAAGRWAEDPRPGACGDARPSFGAELELASERVRVSATVRDAGGEARLDATSEVPWRRWLRDGFVMPSVDATLRSEAITLERLPHACERVRGVARLDVEARDVLGASPRVRADVGVRELRASEGPPVDLVLDAGVGANAGTLSARMQDTGTDRTRVTVDAGWQWEWSGADVPSLDEATWHARARFDEAPIAPLVAMVPSLADPSGAIDGEFRASGTGLEATPEVAGNVELHDVGLTVRDPFVRVSGVRGSVALREGGVAIDGLRYRDLDGELRVDGRVGLAGFSPDEVDLRVRARELPARVEGVIFAYLTADVRVEGDLRDEERRTLDVQLSELAVRVPEQTGRTVQSLDRHPDVTYVDALPGGVGAMGTASREPVEEVTPSEPSTPLVIRVRSTPFWVRRDDFAFQLDANVRSTTDAGVTRIEGPLRIRRGYLELLGKRFDLQPGEIRFSGGSSVDPRLELTALHQLRTGEKVYVDIGGYLSAPTLAFRSPDVDGGDERAVIDLLVRGGSQREAAVTARDQATSVLAGMLAGFLSSMTRRELGAFLPVFRIEAEDARSARVRAGFQADSIIPSWLEGVVRGIYVEGFVGTQEQSGQTRASGGFLLEMLFPFDFVGSGKWEQGNNWSVDLTWEPR